MANGNITFEQKAVIWAAAVVTFLMMLSALIISIIYYSQINAIPTKPILDYSTLTSAVNTNIGYIYNLVVTSTLLLIFNVLAASVITWILGQKTFDFLTERVRIKQVRSGEILQLKSTFNILLLNKTIKNDVLRPGTYKGTHFYDLGDQLLWSNGNGSIPCGTDLWFTPKKKAGDTYTRIGVCADSGMDEYQINLV